MKKMRYILSVIVIFTFSSLIFAGCLKSSGLVYADFENKGISGWSLSEDASYKLEPMSGVSGLLQKSGGRYYSSGAINGTFRVEDSILYVSRYFSAMETEEYLRGLFITSADMIADNSETVTADITVNAGYIAGICVGTDENLNNGFAAVLNLAKKRVEVMRVDNGILTYLQNYQSDVYSSAVSVEEGMAYKLAVKYQDLGNNTFRIIVDVDNEQILDTTISGQGVKEGRGNKISLVASDMNCEFSNLTRSSGGTIAFDPKTLSSIPGDPMSVDEKFKGDLVSSPFKITSDYIALKVGGTRSQDNVKVSLIDQKTGKSLFDETGSGSEEMTRRLWSVKNLKGQTCFIKISDQSKTGHLNVDDILFTDQIPPDIKYSILNSQVGYSIDSVKKAYLRSPLSNTEDIAGAKFTLNKFDSGEKVFEGKVSKLGSYWESNWWELNFSEMTTNGRYVITVYNSDMDIVSTSFVIEEKALSNNSLINTSLNQLDLRRSPNKLGWRDSSTDELREIHAQAMVVHTMLDLLDMQSDWLSDYDKARVIDNIGFGVKYLLAAQELTDDPKTNGRFRHDIYPSQFSADKLRTWSDTAFSMTALARAYPVLQKYDIELAAAAKTAFDISFEMCSLRPYYLPEEYNVEGEGGFQGVESAIRFFYYIREMNWKYNTELRTRDRLLFMYACTLMAKSDSDPVYINQAKDMAKRISSRQFTDYTNTIDGAYGCFYEFDNSDEGMMLEWIQAYNLLLGNQTPTNLQPYIDLLEMLPDDADAAMWYNTIKIYVDGYVKKTAGLTPLGIYPIAAYTNKEVGGIKFFQTISHGATSHFGFSGRNIMGLSLYFSDPELQHLAENNVQFTAGLNPGFPTSPENLQWKPNALLYLIGSRYFKGNFNNGSYTPPIGSGFNGFSASTQFATQTIATDKDMPAGILDKNGNYQYNEDYIPAGIGYSAGVAAIESSVRIPIKTLYGGKPVSAQVKIVAATVRNEKTDSSGELTVSGLRACQKIQVELTYNNMTVMKEITPVSGMNKAIIIDFEKNIEVSLTVPESIDDKGTGKLTIKNSGGKELNIQIKMMSDGVTAAINTEIFILAIGESKVLSIDLVSLNKIKPYLVYAYILADGMPQIATASGLAK